MELYSESIGHSVFYFRNMTDMDDDYILRGYCDARMISTTLGWGFE
jgi:cysteinyl-tRNA synthetase